MMVDAVDTAIKRLQAGDLVEIQLREILEAVYREGYDDGCEWTIQEGSD